MLDMKQLEEAMGKSLTTMEGLQTKVSEAEEKGDEQSVKDCKALFDEEVAKFDGLKAKAEDAKRHMERKKILDDVRKMGEPDNDGNEPKGKSSLMVPAEPIDHLRQDREYTGLFTSYIRGKRFDAFSGEARKAMTPKSERLQNSEEAAGSVRIPDSLAVAILGAKYAHAFGKTMYSVANPAAGLNPSAAQNLVPPDFRAQLQMLPLDVPTVYDRVTVVASGTGNVTWPCLVQTDANEFGGMSFQWRGEGATKPETEPEFEQKEIATHELCGYTEVSERLLSRSAINIEALLAELSRASMIYTLDNAIINGTGVGMPAGIVGTAGIRTVARATANQVQYQDLVRLKHAVKAVHRAGASFVLEDTVEEGLELQMDNFGRPLFRASVANGPYDRLIGYPYLVATNCPTLGTSGDIIYGNLRWYIMAMEEEITMARSSDYQFRNNLVAFKMFTVVGGRLMQPRALAILEAAAS